LATVVGDTDELFIKSAEGETEESSAAFLVVLTETFTPGARVVMLPTVEEEAELDASVLSVSKVELLAVAFELVLVTFVVGLAVVDDVTFNLPISSFVSVAEGVSSTAR
jgi:hypothetical protein